VIRIALRKSWQRHVHEPVVVLYARVVELQSRCGPCVHVLEYDIAASDQLVRHLPGSSFIQIYGQQLLAAIEQRVARMYAASGADEFQNICTLIREQHCRDAPGPGGSDIDDPDTCEWRRGWLGFSRHLI
jgi:hypothetical protein